MKVEVSEKQIVSIKEFMESYVGKGYTGNSKLTHREMQMFLYEKGQYIPERVSFDRVRQEQLLTGEYLAVKDESSQIIFYKNPKRLNFKSLLSELSSKANIEKTKQARRHNLIEQGYQEAINGVVRTEDLEEATYSISKPNRQKQFVNTKGYRRKHY